jgi:hypothetical protein
MNRCLGPFFRFAWLLSLVVIVSFTGTASIGGHFVDACDKLTELGAGMNTHGTMAGNPTFDDDSIKTHHVDAGCSAHICPALSAANFDLPFARISIWSLQFGEPDDPLLTDMSYGLHRPPNA